MNRLEALENEGDKINPLDIILSTYESLRVYFKLLNKDEDYGDFKEEVADCIDKGYTARDMCSGLWLEYLCHHGKDIKNTPIILCTAYCIEAQREVERGDNEKAMFLVDQSKNFFDPKDLESIFEEKLKKDERLRSIKVKGGQVRSNGFKPAKDEVIRLLKIRQPKLGWKNIPVAATCIEKYVIDFNRKNKIGISEVDLNNRLIVWMRTDREIAPVVESLLAKNLLKENFNPK